MNFKIEKGDIINYKVDAIVNAANQSLLGGGGVDGAIHHKAGKQLLEECKALNGCNPGEAKITLGYKLPANYIIHTVGPQILGLYGPTESDIKVLYNTWFNSLKVADEHNIKTIAFPSISTGAYGFPLKYAPAIAERAMRDYEKVNRIISEVIMVCYDDYTYSFYDDWFSNKKEVTRMPELFEYDDKVEKFRDMILTADNIVFISGAGISTESGIPDFRGEAGLYVKENNYKYKPRKMLSKSFLYTHCKEFFQFYRSLYPKIDIEPNVSHFLLTELEKRKNLTIITQNIDGLHEKAGSQNVINLNGTAIKNHCMICRREYQQQEMDRLLSFAGDGVPKCPRCKIGVVRPDAVLYNEMIPIKPLFDAKKAIKNADLIIVGGTTLLVNPAKSLVGNYTGNVVIINQGKTSVDNKANLIFNESISKVLESLKIKEFPYK